LNLKQILKIAGIIVVVALLGYAGFVAWFFYLMGQFEDVEVARFPNPSGSTEVVVVERHGNATVSTKTFLYVVPRKAKLPDTPHFSADYVDGLAVYWKNDKSVEIHAQNARIDGIHYYFTPGPPTDLGTITYKILSIGRPE
jgi:hypothetical protein